MSECLMFGMDCEARCLVAVQADEERVSFFVGTNNIKSDNQVNKLFVDAEGSRLLSKCFRHPAGEVRAIAAHPTMTSVLATCSADYSTLNGKFGLCLWNIDEDKRTLESVSHLEVDHLMHGLEWDAANNRAATLGPSAINLYDMENEPKLIRNVEIADDDEIHCGRWSPHHNGNMLGIAVGKNVCCVDLRTAGAQFRIGDAHSNRTLGIDFNPNLQHVIATSGDDGFVRVWDTRSTSEPLLAMHHHAHWVWQVRYHPVHDQILLSVGSDSCVVLSCAQSVSSEQNEMVMDEEEEDATIEKLQDGQLERIDEHEDSVYACAWSAADPWTFASLSYDGRLILSKVSRKHKYALMQL
ncbi:unnamed protein product [Caenorhabditis bovis]|uniref:EIPR1-like beta-propeller domain-containing protein n=1 Tax=Caenorhabditis bovis TaxID=2654633 RepID=A0A8S1FA56_9PELO|nr:unnamed protein product [Caenorhabditis bovis]